MTTTTGGPRAALLATLQRDGWPGIWSGPFRGVIRGEAAWREEVAERSEEECAAALSLLRGAGPS